MLLWLATNAQRGVLAGAMAIVLCTTLAAVADGPPERFTLRSVRAPGTVDRVERSLAASGTLRVLQATGEAAEKLHVEADFQYYDKLVGLADEQAGHLLAARYYEQAGAQISIEKNTFRPSLPPNRRLLGVEVSLPEVAMFSPAGSLTREQLDLVDAAGDTVLLDLLLPDEPVVVGESWTHSNELLAALLRLDAVVANDVQSVLKEVVDGVARLEIAGQVEGAVQGSATKVELKGRYHFDLTRRRITWAGLLIKEDRGAGPVTPGLDVVARVVATITPDSPSSQLADEVLASQPIEPNDQTLRLIFQPEDRSWELAYDRRWFVTAQDKQMLVLRLLDRGVFLGQCKVATGAGGQKLPLDRFQQDIREALGERFGQFLRAAERQLEPRGRMLEVWVQGTVAEVPVRWTYYAVEGGQGPRVVLAFVSEEQLADRFEEAQRALIGGLRVATAEVASRSSSQQ